jgi:hypothetical protein
MCAAEMMREVLLLATLGLIFIGKTEAFDQSEGRLSWKCSMSLRIENVHRLLYSNADLQSQIRIYPQLYAFCSTLHNSPLGLWMKVMINIR